MAKNRSVVVVAHPDDEILWLSAVLSTADAVVLCFGDPLDQPKKAAARRRAVSELRLNGLANLEIPESGVRRLVDWSMPELGATGMVIRDVAGQKRYDANFARLLAALEPLLAGATDVYTHNPWGEYGHPEHIQVHRAIAYLQLQLGFVLWFSNYVGQVNLELAQRLRSAPSWSEKRNVLPDLKLAKRLRRTYLRQGAWTWSRWHRWPPAEVLYAQPPGDQRAWRSLRGEALLDVTALRWWRRPQAAWRCLI